MVNNGKFKKHHKKPNKFKGNGNGKNVAKPSTKSLKPTRGVAKEGKCFYYGKTRHQNRNCPKYLEDKKNGTVVTTSSGTFVIEINMSTSTSWVLDTRCGSHICTDVKVRKTTRRGGGLNCVFQKLRFSFVQELFSGSESEEVQSLSEFRVLCSGQKINRTEK